MRHSQSGEWSPVESNGIHGIVDKMGEGVIIAKSMSEETAE
jgi:hypothetical protein